MDYTVKKANIVPLYPQTTIRFKLFSKDLVFYGLAIMPNSLSEAGIHKKYLDALSFFPSGNQPQLPVRHSDAAILCRSMDMLYNKKSHGRRIPVSYRNYSPPLCRFFGLTLLILAFFSTGLGCKIFIFASLRSIKKNATLTSC